MKLRKHFMTKVAAGAVALSLTAAGGVFAQDGADDMILVNDTVMDVVDAGSVQGSGIDSEHIRNNSFTDRLNPANYVLDPHNIVNPQIDPYIIGGAAALFSLLCLTAIARRRNPAASSLVLLSGMAATVALLNPAFVNKEEERRPTEVAVVIDRSASQFAGDRMEESEAVAADVVEQLKALGIDESHIHIISTDGVAENGGTNIFTSLPDALSGVAPRQYGGTIVITDGQIHDVPDELRGLVAQAPFYGVISGDENDYDRYVDVHVMPSYGIVGQTQDIIFSIVDSGATEQAPSTARVTIRVDGQVREQMTVTPDTPVTWTLDIDHNGENIVEIETDSVAEELSLRNNKTAFSVMGVRDSMRVFLGVGNPYAGSVVWRMALKSDPNIDLLHFNILRHAGQGAAGMIPVDEMSLIAFPIAELFEERLEDIDLIVLDSMRARLVMQERYMDNIREYVLNGGALLIVNDDEFGTWQSVADSSISDILPAQPPQQPDIISEAYQPAISDQGERHPVTRNLAEAQDPEEWGRWFRMVGTEDVTGDVLMEGADGKPLLIMGRAGEGRVVMLMSNQAWLWQKNVDGGGPYIELLRNITQWAMKDPSLEEEALRLSHEDGVLTVQRQTMQDTDILPPATITDPAGNEMSVAMREIKPGLWQGQIDVDDIGLYEARHQELSIATSVGLVNPLEYKNITATIDILAPVAEQTGGAVLRFNRSATGGVSAPSIVALDSAEATAREGEIGIRMNQDTILRSSERQSLPAWIYYIVAIGGLAMAYFIEGGGRRKKTPDGASVKADVKAGASAGAGVNTGSSSHSPAP